MHIKYAKTFWQQLIGLMFLRKNKFNYALIFTLPKESIKDAILHTWFVFFRIDIAFFNANKELVDYRENVRPFSLIKPSQLTKTIIELPAGQLQDFLKEYYG